MAMDVVIKSHLFWPTSQETDSFQVSETLTVYHFLSLLKSHLDQNRRLKVLSSKKKNRFMETYEKGYGAHQPMRTLKWHHDAGQLALHLTFDDDTFYDVQCTPAQASLLDIFADNSNQSSLFSFYSLNSDQLKGDGFY